MEFYVYNLRVDFGPMKFAKYMRVCVLEDKTGFGSHIEMNIEHQDLSYVCKQRWKDMFCGKKLCKLLKCGYLTWVIREQRTISWLWGLLVCDSKTSDIDQIFFQELDSVGLYYWLTQFILVPHYILIN